MIQGELKDYENPLLPFEVHMVSGSVMCYVPIMEGNSSQQVSAPQWECFIIHQARDDADFEPKSPREHVGYIKPIRMIDAIPDYYLPSLVAYLKATYEIVTAEIDRLAGEIAAAASDGQVHQRGIEVIACGNVLRSIVETTASLHSLDPIIAKSHAREDFGNDQDPKRIAAQEEARRQHLEAEAQVEAQERATCGFCMARGDRGEECVCEDDGPPSDIENYDEALADERAKRGLD